MNFALHFRNSTFPSPKDVKNIALTAEAAGFKNIIAVEHVVIPPTYKTKYPYNETGGLPSDMKMAWPDSFTWPTFVGGVTTKLLLIIGVLVLPQRNPLILANHLVTTQYLIEGRFELGVRVGYGKSLIHWEFGSNDEGFEWIPF